MHTHGRYQTYQYHLPCYAVDNNLKLCIDLYVRVIVHNFRTQRSTERTVRIIFHLNLNANVIAQMLSIGRRIEGTHSGLVWSVSDSVHLAYL